MTDTYIFIDETGTPGQKTNSKYGGPSLCSWFAILVSQKEKSEIEGKINNLKNRYLQSLNLDEFHFVELYNGKGDWRLLSIETRLHIMYDFADIYKSGNYPLFVQSLDDNDYERLKITREPSVSISNFKLNNVKDFALILLFNKLKCFLNKHSNRYKLPVQIIIDEGRQKNNSKCRIDLLGNNLKDQTIEFRSSKSEPLLQLIDFIAFSLNRNRYLLSQNKKSQKDLSFLQMTTYANFEVNGLKRGLVNYMGNTTEQYDNFIDEENRKHNEFVQDITIEEFKKLLIQ
ncbi:MAG: DUF3800 domain-containing protein [Alistipes sp.]|nr:DUF3800 domain-containing protein [Alistipes sp.]